MKKKKLSEAEKAARLYNAIFDTTDTDYIDASDQMIKCSLDCAIKEAEYLKERTERSDIEDGLKYLRRYIDNAETFLLERAEQYEVNGEYVPDEEENDGENKEFMAALDSLELTEWDDDDSNKPHGRHCVVVHDKDTGEMRERYFETAKEAAEWIAQLVENHDNDVQR